MHRTITMKNTDDDAIFRFIQLFLNSIQLSLSLTFYELETRMKRICSLCESLCERNRQFRHNGTMKKHT